MKFEEGEMCIYSSAVTWRITAVEMYTWMLVIGNTIYTSLRSFLFAVLNCLIFISK